MTETSAEPHVLQRAGRRGDYLPWIVLALMVCAFGFGFAWLSILRHLAFQSHAFDLGNMDQAVWSSLHGSPLRFTDMVVPGEIARHPAGAHVLTDRLAIHVEPLLLPIALLYLVHSGPETLLVLQALVVASGAVPAYLLARSVLHRTWISLAFPAAYLLHPSLQNALLDDFHAVTLAAAFLLWAMYFLYADAMAGFWVMALLSLACKEEIGLLVALLGIVALKRHRLQGAIAVTVGLLWFVLCVAVIIPHFNPGGQSPYLSRYAYLGHGLRGVLLGALRHPGVIWNTATSESRLTYLGALLAPAGFISLLGFPVLILVAPTLAINMLSADPTMYSGFYQYSAEVVPYVVVSAIAGTALAAGATARVRGGRWVAPILAAIILLASIVSTRTYGFTPLAEGFTVPSVGPHQQLETTLLRSIPSGVVVAAADEVEPHLSGRRTIYLLPAIRPQNGPPAEYVALDVSVPALPTTPETLHEAAGWALNHGYGVKRAADGVLILQRGASRRRLPSSFFDFAFNSPGAHATKETAAWGRLHLVAVTVHPGDGWINRSRPAIEVETYWRLTAPLPRGIRIKLSAVRSTGSPALSSAASVDDSPTWDWMPFARWPVGRTVHAALVPMSFQTYSPSTISLVLTVSGVARLAGASAGQRVPGNPAALRIGSVRIRP